MAKATGTERTTRGNRHSLNLQLILWSTQFKTTIAEAGMEQFVAQISERPVQIDVPSGHSAHWIKAFREGIQGMRNTVLRAYQERGLPEIDIELSRPIDASENAKK